MIFSPGESHMAAAGLSASGINPTKPRACCCPIRYSGTKDVTTVSKPSSWMGQPGTQGKGLPQSTCQPRAFAGLSETLAGVSLKACILTMIPGLAYQLLQEEVTSQSLSQPHFCCWPINSRDRCEITATLTALHLLLAQGKGLTGMFSQTLSQWHQNYLNRSFLFKVFHLVWPRPSSLHQISHLPGPRFP